MDCHPFCLDHRQISKVQPGDGAAHQYGNKHLVWWRKQEFIPFVWQPQQNNLANHPCRLSFILYHLLSLTLQILVVSQSLGLNQSFCSNCQNQAVKSWLGTLLGVQMVSLNDFCIISFLLRQSWSLHPRHLSVLGTSNTYTTGVRFLGVNHCRAPCSIPHHHWWVIVDELNFATVLNLCRNLCNGIILVIQFLNFACLKLWLQSK